MKIALIGTGSDARRHRRPAGFSLKLGRRDANLARNAATQLSVPMPILDLMCEQYDAAMKKGWGEKDRAAIAQLPLEKAGL